MSESRSVRGGAQRRTELAISRTLMAAERSLMASIRTGVALIGFGFTIYEFLNQLRVAVPEIVLRTEGPRRLGMILIGLGVAAVAFAMVEYVRFVRSVNPERPASPWRFSLVGAGSVVVLGLYLLLAMFLHRELL